MGKVKILIAKSAACIEGLYSRKFEIIEEVEVPNEFLKHFINREDPEIQMQYKVSGVTYSNVIKKHTIDRINEAEKADLLTLFKEREKIQQKINAQLQK